MILIQIYIQVTALFSKIPDKLLRNSVQNNLFPTLWKQKLDLSILSNGLFS